MTNLFPCPIEDCIEDYPGADNLSHMKQHFQRAHRDLANVAIQVGCKECGAVGFGKSMAEVRAHHEKHFGARAHSPEGIPSPQGEEVCVQEAA